MDEEQEDEFPDYSAPKIVRGIHNFLSKPRNFNTNEFSDLVSPDSKDQKEYYYGLIFVSVLVLSVFMVWGSILVILKFMGHSVGCASGNSVGSIKNDVGYSEETGSVQSDLSGSDEFFDDIVEENAVIIAKRQRRERRIRIAFGLAAIVTVTCSIMALVWAYTPLKNSLEQSDETITVSQDIIDDVVLALGRVTLEIDNLNNTFMADSMNATSFCPNVDTSTVEGLDIESFGGLIEEQYLGIESALKNITQANHTVDKIQDILNAIQRYMDRADDSLWVVPGLLAAVCVTTAIAFFGLVLAWKGKSGVRTQRGMAYVILPLLIVFTVACWVLTIGAGVGAMTIGDACVGNGNPDQAVLMIMQEYNVSSNDTLHDFVSNYTNGCIGESPTAMITDIGQEMKDTTNLIWRHISVVDSVGKDVVSQSCGRDIEDLLTIAKSIAYSLLLIRKGLSSLASALECDRINAIYVRAVHESACTDAASGASWGFVLFFLLSMSTMVSITLRAAFYQKGKEENMYEEEEVAENMVLDEHEEYLNYISKYKHEWQEYNGINATSIDVQNESDDGSEESFDDEDDLLNMDSNDYSDAEYDSDSRAQTPFSYSSDDISFPSLQGGSDGSQQGEASGPWIPPLLPPMSIAAHPNQDDETVDSTQINLPVVVQDKNASGLRKNEADKTNISIAKDHDNVEVSLQASIATNEEREEPPLPRAYSQREWRSPPSDDGRPSNNTHFDEVENMATSIASKPRGRAISFAMDDAAQSPDTNVNQKVDLFSKLNAPAKPPTPGRNPRIKPNESAFFG